MTDEKQARALLITRLQTLVADGKLDDMGWGRVRWHKPWFRPAVLVSDCSTWAGRHLRPVERMTTPELLFFWEQVQRHLECVRRNRERLMLK